MKIFPQYSHVSFRPDLPGVVEVLFDPLPLLPPSDFGPEPDPSPRLRPGGVPVMDPFVGEERDIGDGGVPDPPPRLPCPSEGPDGQGDDEVE